MITRRDFLKVTGVAAAAAALTACGGSSSTASSAAASSEAASAVAKLDKVKVAGEWKRQRCRFYDRRAAL